MSPDPLVLLHAGFESHDLQRVYDRGLNSGRVLGTAHTWIETVDTLPKTRIFFPTYNPLIERRKGLQVVTRPMTRRRRVVFPYYYSTDKKLFHVVVKIRDVPGALAGVLTLLTTEVNLLGSTSYSIEDNSAMFSCFAEALRKSETSEEIQSLLAMSPWVLESNVSESKSGLLVDSFHTGVQVGNGESYIMFPTAGIADIFEKLVKTFGSGGETILYELGRNFGYDRFELYRPLLGPEPRTRVGEAAHIFQALGYGASTITLNPDGSIRIVVHDCFECTTPSEIGRSCAFRRGLAAGSLAALLEHETECQETKCKSKGAGFCEFVVTQRQK